MKPRAPRTSAPGRRDTSFPSPRMRTPWLACLVLIGWNPGFAATPASAPPPALAALLARERIDPATLETVYNEAILRDGVVDATVRQLATSAQDAALPARVRVNALLLTGHLQWRFGRLPAATAAIDQAIAIATTGDLARFKARLLEAAGNLPEARRWYEQALAQLQDPEDLEEVRLRLTFLATDAQHIDALVTLARSRDREFRNRAAVALAILDQPGAAADLYEVFGEEAQRQRQHLRLAQWAVRAGQAQKAQTEAWEAVRRGNLTRDVRYSLSILVEAHELDESWEKLLARLAEVPEPGPDLQAVRVDVLRRLRRFSEAIALVESGRATDMTPENQRRLLRMYAEAGRTDAMVAEFRQLIARDPAQVSWPRGLSEHYLEQGNRESAAQVWRDFAARNTSPDALLEGGRAMAQAGFDELALAVAEQCLKANPDSGQRVGWYRFEHFLRRGQTARAEAELDRLEKELAPDAPGRVEIAEAYERIKNPKRALAVWEALAKRPDGIGVEEKMRLAWLLDTVGRRDEALAVWRGLWEKDVPEARRRMVEDRLLLLAAETGALGDLAVEIEQKLAQGTAAARDSSLLIRIYTEAGDSAAAIEVIQEYYSRREKTPAAEIASLKEQARVYQTLNRHAAFAQVTEKLLALDTENRTDHLQALILGHIERGGRREGSQLQQRLTELRAVNAAAGDEFEAGVLVLAGLRDQAINSYRRALARQPGHSDNYLLLADLLKQDRRIDEGVAILQYFAEIAPGDDGFMVAIDGILNLKPAADSPALRWAQRRVLERLTRREDKFYLYDLSAEVAEAIKDTRGYLSALENSLVEAGPRRTAVLRELISATEERSGFMSGPAVAPDAQRNLSFSRRLIALGEEMPPEVYLNVGRTFLRMGNPAEALEAFNLALDRTDRPSLVEESADRFESAGYSTEATALYEKALTADSANASVMAKLAQVRSRESAPELANDMYLRALLLLGAQQVPEVEASERRRVTAPDDGYSFLFKRHYWNLQAGFIFTLPAGAGSSATPPAALAALETALDQALAEVLQRAGGRTSKPFASYPRLGVFARVLRQAALALGRYEQADRLDLKLLQHFSHDTRFVAELTSQRLAWGLRTSADKLQAAGNAARAAAPAPTAAPAAGNLAGRTVITRTTARPTAAGADAPVDLAALSSLTAAARQALAQRNYELAADAALAAGDQALAFSVFQQWLASRRTAATARSASGSAAASALAVAGGVVVIGPSGPGSAGSLTQIAGQARRKLSPENFTALCQQIATLAAQNEEVARELVAGLSSMDLYRPTIDRSPLFAIEEAAGRPLFTGERLAALVGAIDGRLLTSLDLDYVMPTLPPAERPGLFVRHAQAMPLAPYWAPTFHALATLLAQPLEPAAATRVANALKDRFQKVAKSPSGLRIYNGSWTSFAAQATARLHQANTAWLAALDHDLKEAHPETFPTGLFGNVQAASRGPASLDLPGVIDGALREIAQVEPNYPVSYLPYRIRQYLQTLADQIYPQRKAALLELLAQRAAGGITPPLFAITVAVHAADPAGGVREQVAWLEDLHRRQPDFRPALETLYPLYAQLGEADKERDVLERLIAVSPDAERYRARLASLWRTLDHPENTLKALGGRARTALPGDAQSAAIGVSIYGMRYPQIGRYAAQLSAPETAPAARPALRGLLQLLVPSGAPPNYSYQVAQSGAPVMDYATFFDLGRVAPETPGPARVAGGVTSTLLPLLEAEAAAGAEPGRAPRLTDSILAQPYAVAELESVVRTLDPAATETDDQYLFYPLLADAYARHGRLAAEFARLTPLVQAGKAGKKDLLIWFELAIRQPAEVLPGLPALVEAALPRAGAFSDYQRIQLARLYARAGQRERAAGMYSVATVSAMAATTYRYSRGDRLPLFSATGLAADAAKHLDREGLGQFLTAFMQVTKPSGGAAYEYWHQRLVFWILERAVLAGVSQEQIRAIAALADAKGARREDLVRYALARSRIEAPSAALPALQAALRRPPELPSQLSDALRDQNVARYSRNLGLSSVGFSGTVIGAANPGGVLQLQTLFPTGANAGAGAHPWLLEVARALPEWIQAGEVEAELALPALALVTLRLQQAGRPEAAAAAHTLARQLGSTARLSMATATLALAVAEKAGAAVDTAVVRQLVAHRQLEVRQLAGVIRRVAASDGVPAALALGETALTYTQNDELLGELESLAQKAGDAARAAKFKATRQQAATARAALENTKRPAGSAERA